MTERMLFRRGMGDWVAWGDDTELIFEAAIAWRARLAGVAFPWLCWNVDPDWSLLQQRLVLEVGWTPVVGFDPRVGPPPVLPHSILIDFNEKFGLPTLYPHFPLEFAFLFCERIAFWHSDLLIRLTKMRDIAEQFKSLQQGQLAAVSSIGLRSVFFPREQRFWELVGCTTKDASRDQYEKGCGWWKCFFAHKNRAVNRADRHLNDYYWDHGAGIMYWKRKHGGKVLSLREKDFQEGHFSQIKARQYERVSQNNEFRNLNLDLRHNFDLVACAQKMGLEDLLD